MSVSRGEYHRLQGQSAAAANKEFNQKQRATRFKQSGNRNDALSAAINTQSFPLESDVALPSSLSANTQLADLTINSDELTLINRDSAQTQQILNSARIAGAEAGLGREELDILVESLKQSEISLAALPISNLTAQEANTNGGNISALTDPNDPTQPLQSNVITLNDIIRHQLANDTNLSDKKRNTLESILLHKPPKMVRAVNVFLKIDSKSCIIPRNSNSLIGVMFREKSRAIRGTSLNALDGLIDLRKRCDGKLLVEDHAGAISASDIELSESRRDEVKYYLLQRHVPAESIVLSTL